MIAESAGSPWQGHDFAVLFAVLIAGATTVLGLALYLCSRFTRQARRRRTSQAVWRDVSLVMAALGIALYLWGCLHVLFLGDQEQAEACERGRPEGVTALVGRRGDFVPLRLVCEAAGGRDYSVVIPGFVNPVLAVLLSVGLVCALVAAILHRGRRTAS
ncbi:hypothetical protein AB0I93_16655 [Streptomyces sp. NPDC049967]|uniref:hypothetical protein n=1 Tax=unclassified Streptomyces TaxID=2593676 RepID=UPI002E287EC4|nr:hypothetical protein [Streptomyces sp. NBC_00342]WSJ23160.1 hypothetical protein OG384_14795 [Streptomyces sp. NBC_01324]